MDLRTLKTKDCIKEAFFDLRRKKPLEQIRVKELAEAARINKATFYLHYRDIFDLSEQLEESAFRKAIENFSSAVDPSGTPKQWVFRGVDVFRKQDETFFLLFSGSRRYRFFELCETKWLPQIVALYPKESRSEELELTLSILTMGSAHAYFNRYVSNNREGASPHVLYEVVGTMSAKLFE